MASWARHRARTAWRSVGQAVNREVVIAAERGPCFAFWFGRHGAGAYCLDAQDPSR